MQQYIKNLGKVSLTSEGAWVINKSFEKLSVVYDENSKQGFISRKDVPIGVDINNREYWMPLNFSGYADNNIIILSEKISDTNIKSYTLKEAINSITSVGRKPGAILGFYNENSDRLDIGGRWEIWQFNSTTISEWEDVSHWQNIYYNYNKFVGWYKSENALKQYNPFPEIGCYAFVGTELNEATIYRCDEKYVWKDTTQHAWDYIKVIINGTVTVGKNGNWFNNGVDTNIPASVKGENGKTPIFRNNNNIIEFSYDNESWKPISNEIAAWFRWESKGGQQTFSTGKIQITRDGVTWIDLSGEFVNNLRISRYIGTNESLPTSGIAEGTIYAKGPTYAEDDTLNENPIYRLWVYAWKDNTLAWQDNGEFQSISVGIVQETGSSETEVMSQRAVTAMLNSATSKSFFFKKTFNQIEAVEAYENAIQDMFIDVSKFNAVYVELWYYSSGTLNVMAQKSGSEKVFILSGKDLNSVSNGDVINLTHNGNIIGFIILKDKSLLIDNPLYEGLPMNVETITRNAQYHALNDKFKNIDGKVLLFKRTDNILSQPSIDNYENSIGGMFIDPNRINVSYVEVWCYHNGSTGVKSVNCRCKVAGSDNFHWLIQTLDLTNVEENIPIPLIYNRETVGYLSIKDKALFSKESTEGREINIEAVTRNIQYSVLKTEIDKKFNMVNEALYAGMDKTLYELNGEVDYYRQFESGYSAFMIGQQTGAIQTDIEFNSIVVGPIRMTGGSNVCQYEVYITEIAGTDFVGKATRKRVQQGELLVSSEFKEYELFLEMPMKLKARSKVAVIFYNNMSNKPQILGSANEEAIQVFQGSLPCLFYLDEVSDLNEHDWYQGYITESGNRGFVAVQPTLKLKTQSLSPSEFDKFNSDVNKRLDDLNAKVESGGSLVEVQLPDRIYAVEGDVLQLFYRSIVKAVNPYNYDIVVECSKGNAYPRHWTYYPYASDVGVTQLSVSVKNEKGSVLAKATTELHTIAAPVSPSRNINIFTFGDSLTSNGVWVGEANRRLTNSNTVDNIKGKGLKNITFCGSKAETKNDTTTQFFGVGGWTWNSYLTKGTTQYRVYVTGVTSVAVGSKYSNNGVTFTVSEVNITSGTGNMLLSGGSSSPLSSGVLTKVEGDGDLSINYNRYEIESANPLWDVNNNKMSFKPYVDKYGGGVIDVAYVLLTWNGQSAWKNYSASDISGHIAEAKIFIETFHNEYPNGKLKIMGLQMPSLNGGLGDNYGASGGYTERYGLYACAFNYNKALQDLCNMDTYKDYCEYVDVASQFDSENNMPEAEAKVNYRSSKKELRGTNGVHPSESGYYQIGDVVYRNVVANYCK